LKSSLGIAVNKELPREPTVPPRSGFVGTFLLAGCLNTASDGTYQFLNTDSFRSYSIIAKAPVGFEQVTPSASDRFAWKIFLAAGGVVNDRDFAIRRVQSTGQSSASAVSGRLFDDRNGNNVDDAGVDSPIANREVYLDATNFGVRDPNEPRVLTDANGLYSINGLSSRTVAVTTTLDESLIHLSPLGSDFKVQRFPLFNTLRPFGNPQAIASGDFNQDGFLDVAVALGEGNKISIRLNNGQGGFLTDEIDIDLGVNGSGPTSIVIGQFDHDGKLTYTAAANVSGGTTISVTLKDNGGIASGGSDTKNDFFLINIQPINDAPSIRINGKQIVSQGAGLQTVNGFATGFLPGGGADELTQTIAGFVISVDKPRLFNVFPAISSLGVLTFSPSITKSGIGIVNVQVRDNGGSGNGGKDLSSVMTFEIEVTLLGGSNGDDFGDAPSAAQSGFASSYPTLLVDNGTHWDSTLKVHPTTP